MLWLALTACLLAGSLLATALAPCQGRPRCAVMVRNAALGALFGPGLASVLFFALLLTGGVSKVSVLTLLLLLVAGCAALWRALPRVDVRPTEPAPGFPWTWVLVLALSASAVAGVLHVRAAHTAFPSGEWDALWMWNLRARYLASGEAGWRRAVYQRFRGYATGTPQPMYPLFLPGVVAFEWVLAGEFNPAAPFATSILFPAATAILLGTSLALRRSAALGTLACLVLLGAGQYVWQTAWQYSDLLLGLAFLATVVLLDQAQEAGAAPRLLVAAGLAAGLAPWIKDEGWPFAIAAIGMCLWRFRPRTGILVFLGAVPGLAATVFLKLVAQGRVESFPTTLGESLEKIANPERWTVALKALASAAWNMGPPAAHPLLLLTALALVLRFVPSGEGCQRLWLAIPILAPLAAEFAVYLITTMDLALDAKASASRFLNQIWAPSLWLVFSLFRSPESYFTRRKAAAN